MTTVTRFTVHQDVAAVEHDDSTRQPRKGGKVHHATVTAVDMNAVQVRYGDEAVFGGRTDVFWLSGWRAWDGQFRWRLVLLCRCESPILGEPVTAENGEEFCGGDCRDEAAGASYEARYQPGVAT